MSKKVLKQIAKIKHAEAISLFMKKAVEQSREAWAGKKCSADARYCESGI